MRRYRLWSNEHGAWVRPRVNGFTGSLDEAGCFSLVDAQVIQDNIGGHEMIQRTDPFTGRVYRQYNVVIMEIPEVLAPVPA